jgi:hypothetical protein
MSPLLLAAIEEANALAPTRGWASPSPQAIGEAQRLLDLLQPNLRPPVVQVQPDGRISLEWESGARGWLQLAVAGAGTLTHSAVIDGYEYELEETFGDVMPTWAAELLHRLLGEEH